MRRLAAALAGAALFPLAIAIAWIVHPATVIDFTSDWYQPRVLFRWFLPFAETSGRRVAWTPDQATLTLPGFDRHVPLDVDIQVGAPRPNPPAASFTVDGIQTLTQQTTMEFAPAVFAVPVARNSRDGLTLGFQSSSVWRPDWDPRDAGFAVDRVVIAPQGWARPPLALLGHAALWGLLLGAMFAWSGLPRAAGAGALVLLAGMAATLARLDVAAYGDWPRWMTGAAIGVGAIAIALPAAWRSIAAAAGAGVWLNAALILHPLMPIADTGFHVHRFLRVLDGDYFFTSVAPGGDFPYPVAFYVVASWFTGLTRDWTVLLRVTAVAADGVAAFALGWAALRVWRRPGAAALAVALVSCLPGQFHTHALAFLTNLFGHAAMVAGLALVAAVSPLWLAAAAATPVLAISLLSHTGTLIATVAVLACLAAVQWLMPPPGRRLAAATAIALAVSASAAVGLYYARFGDTYRTLLAKPPAAADAAAVPVQRLEPHQTMWVPGWPAMRNRLAAIPGYVERSIGWPILLLAAAGAARRIRRGDRDRLSLVLYAWMAGSSLLLILGQLTSIDVRYYLAVGPALAVFAADALADAWDGGRRLIAIAGGAACLVLAAMWWLSAIVR